MNAQEILYYSILHLLLDMVNFFKDNKSADESLKLYRKKISVKIINALNWKFFHLAIFRLHIAMEKREKISPDIKYTDEMKNLTFQEIIDHINELLKP